MLNDHNDEIRAQIQYRLTEELVLARRRYLTFAEHVPDVIFECDADGVLTFVNSAWERLFNVTPQDSVGHSISEYFSAVVPNGSLEVRLGRPQELCFTGPDEATRWAELTFWPGPHDSLVGLVHDITDRKLADQSIQDQHDRLEREHANLRAIFDTVPVAMLIVDPDFNVSRYNAAAAKLIGFGCTEASRERLGDLLHCVRAHYTRPTQRKTRCSDCVIRDAIEAVLQRNQEVQGVETPL